MTHIQQERKVDGMNIRVILSILVIVLFAVFVATVSAKEQGKGTKPVIGIAASGHGKVISVDSAYIDAVIAAGGIPILIPSSSNEELLSQSIHLIDGLILTGGEDINPSFYHEQPSPRLEQTNKDRDLFEWTLLKLAVERSVPILGICRGHQLIAVFFGGSLYQDIPSEYEKPLCHRIAAAQLYTYRHEVKVTPDSCLGHIFKSETISVNSQHHQAVKKVPQDFKVVAKTADGLVEAMESDRYPGMISVQWHPEQLVRQKDENSQRLFAAFIELAQKKMAKVPDNSLSIVE